MNTHYRLNNIQVASVKIQTLVKFQAIRSREPLILIVFLELFY